VVAVVGARGCWWLWLCELYCFVLSVTEYWLHSYLVFES
jgi:hypothetical protein